MQKDKHILSIADFILCTVVAFIGSAIIPSYGFYNAFFWSSFGVASYNTYKIFKKE